MSNRQQTPHHRTDPWGMPRTPYISTGEKSPGYTVILPKIARRAPRWFTGQRSIEVSFAQAIAYQDKWLPASHRARVRRADNREYVRRACRGIIDRPVSSLGKPGIDITNTGTGPHDGTNRYVRAFAYDATRRKSVAAH